MQGERQRERQRAPLNVHAFIIMMGPGIDYNQRPPYQDPPTAERRKRELERSSSFIHSFIIIHSFGSSNSALCLHRAALPRGVSSWSSRSATSALRTLQPTPASTLSYSDTHLHTAPGVPPTGAAAARFAAQRPDGWRARSARPKRPQRPPYKRPQRPP